MTVRDWCDVAWALAIRDTPALANPFEFREMMYKLIYEGVMPEKVKEQSAKAKVEDAKRTIEAARNGERQEAPKDAMAGLAALVQRARQLQGAEQS